jgi:hypothetical protein
MDAMINRDNITQTEYRVMRETLGVPVEWIAERLGVQTRSAQRWESKAQTPPIQPAIDLVCDAYEYATAEARYIVEGAADRVDGEPVKLYRYWNQAHIDQVEGAGANDVELHNATVRIAYLLLQLHGIEAEVHVPEFT